MGVALKRIPAAQKENMVLLRINEGISTNFAGFV